MTEDEMVGWHHWFDRREFEWTPGVVDGQGGLVCCNSWGSKELDMTEPLNWTDGCMHVYIYKISVCRLTSPTSLFNSFWWFIVFLWVSACWILIPIKFFNERCFSGTFFYWEVSVLHTQVVSTSWFLRICVHLVHTLATLSRLSINFNTFSLLLLQILYCTCVLSP